MFSAPTVKFDQSLFHPLQSGEEGSEAEPQAAGAESVAGLLHGVINASCKSLCAPANRRGGRLVKLFEGSEGPLYLVKIAFDLLTLYQ